MKSENNNIILGSGSRLPVAPQPSSDTTTIQCPECGSQRLWKDGMRYEPYGEIQRYLCRSCAHRFSFSEGSEHSEHHQKLQTLRLRMKAPLPFYRNRLGDASDTGKAALTSLTKPRPETRREPCNQHEAVNEMETRTQEQAAGATTTDLAILRGKIVEHLLWLKNEGYQESTIESRGWMLRRLLKEGADFLNPGTLKETIARQSQWCEGTKFQAVRAYLTFVTMLKQQGFNVDFKPPSYKQEKKYPFIPTEEEIDTLIAACGKTLATFLQIIKETGMRPGEAWRLKWIDIDLERRNVRIIAEKGSNPRISNISEKLVTMLSHLPRTSERIFTCSSKRIVNQNFHTQRKRAAWRLGNPRLLAVTFCTIRHWKATMEYHRTKDILYVMRVLGHKDIKNTLIYIDIERAVYGSLKGEEFTARVAANAKEACELIEAGFEYVTGEYNDGGKLFRRRK